MSWDKTTIASILAVMMPMSAFAADKGGERPSFLPIGEMVKKATSWTGVYAGVGGGYQVADTELSAPGFSIIDGISGNGWAGDGRVGFDWQASGTPIVLGVLGGYNVGEAEFNAFDGGLSATLTPTWYAGGRVGIALPTHTLIYGGAAWQEAKGTVSADGLGSVSETEQGIMYIAGIEQIVAPTLTLGAEYSLAQYEFDADDLNIDPDVHAFKVRLNWRPLSK